MKRTRGSRMVSVSQRGIVVGIDVGQRYLAWCKIRYDTGKSANALPASETSNTLPDFPEMELVDWSLYDLGDAKDTRSVVESIVKFIKSGHIMKEPTPTVIAIEQQFGHNNPRMTVISHVLQAGLLLSVPDGLLCPTIVFQNASSKFYMFKGIGVSLPHETKGLSHAESYRLTKENSKWLAISILLPRLHNTESFLEVYKKAHKQDDLADCMGIAVTHVLRHISKLKKPTAKSKKQLKLATEIQSSSCTEETQNQSQ